MSAILKFDFQKWKQLHFSEEIILTTQKDTISLVDNYTFSIKQQQTRPSSGPILGNGLGVNSTLEINQHKICILCFRIIIITRIW